ncbi:MAG: FAD-binding domain-containing protein, partial [Bacteroidota bacterium]
AAATGEPVLPLYIAEPSVQHAEDFSSRHWRFIRGCLVPLRANLAHLGQPLIVRVGEAVEVLESLRQVFGPLVLRAHEETGVRITYDRDLAVAAWAKQHGIPFHESPQHGVIRGLKDRDRWAGNWERQMRAPLVQPPKTLVPVPGIDPGPIPTADELRLAPMTGGVQAAGEAEARETLRSFLYERGQPYQRAMSSPVTAFEHCSRLSPHIAWGSISIRTILHATLARRDELRASTKPGTAEWIRSLRSFESRLHWHCHFIQKLESEPDIEFRSFVPAYDALREDAFDPKRYEAWMAGQTGYPMVDACMRALVATGYLNFRMRAMIVSFACYNLWLDWRRLHGFIARQWTDYEPGIHLSQLQMQSGTSGINAIRIYNPVKQSREQDPDGEFIREWLPELRSVPAEYIHEPWTMPAAVAEEAACLIGQDYPWPIVDLQASAKAARERIYALRRQPEVQAQAERVVQRHGSRKRRKRKAPAKTDARQGTLGF